MASGVDTRNGDSTSWGARHMRLRRLRGKAAAHDCVDCGYGAAHWSQIHGTDGMDLLAHYEPRCRSCHMKYDYTDEHREKVRAANLGKKLSEETKAKISATGKGIARRPAGWTHSQEARMKISEAAVTQHAEGRANPWGHARG